MTRVVGVKLKATPDGGDDERRQDAQHVRVAVVDRGEQKVRNSKQQESEEPPLSGVRAFCRAVGSTRMLIANPASDVGSMAKTGDPRACSRTC